MTAAQIIAALARYHPPLTGQFGPESVDKLICGDPNTPITGIALTLQPTPDVIRQAAAAGCNFLMCHEPTWFNGMDRTDWLEGDPVYAAKRELLAQTGLCIYRNHDHVHAHRPDCIFEGLAIELGWKAYERQSEEPGGIERTFDLPKTTARAVAEHLIARMGLHGLRLIGDPETPVERVSIIAHMSFLSQESDLRAIQEADLLIPGEVIDFSALSYAREACMLGRPKAILNIGHYNLERLGMAHCVVWMRELFPALPVQWIDSGDPYCFL